MATNTIENLQFFPELCTNEVVFIDKTADDMHFIYPRFINNFINTESIKIDKFTDRRV